MAAYAALASLKHIIDQLQQHPFSPISLDKEQAESLTKNVTFLQEFLQGYDSPFGDSEEADPMESRMADAAHTAEDAIESHIVDMIKLGASTSRDEEKVGCSINLYQDLQQVIEDMDLIKRETTEIIGEKEVVVQHQLQRNVSESSGSSRSSSTMVGFDDVLLETMEKLTAGQRLDRQIIPIVGMGGIGKTTLARNIYAHPLIREYFDICAWATISQQYNTKEILCHVLSQAQKETEERLRGMSEADLGLALYKYLSRRRFLIVMDDMWSIEAWDKIKCYFPNDNNGSRIVVTTRQSELGSQLDKDVGPQMKFLDDVSSWNLFCKTVFEDESCPHELKGIGEEIVRSCKGLPLSIVVVGGLVRGLERTQECWGPIMKNLNSIVNLENDKHCFKIMKMSYNHLQAYLKPCFLYMGVFEEDRAICVSTLINLWASEGFLQPMSGKSLKRIGEEYVKKLVDRNLILVDELGSTGNIKYCKVHDLLRDLCLREAERERFYHVINHDSPQGISSQRCVVIPRSTSKEKAVDALESLSHARSIICDENNEVRLPPNLRLLRILHAFDRCKLLHYENFVKNVFEFVNLRYLVVGAHSMPEIPSSVNLLWNLHTLIVYHPDVVTAPVEIWNMLQLRHVEFALGGLYLPHPPSSSSNGIVIMENLHTLIGARSLMFDEEVIQRIPNIEKLGIEYCNVKGIKSYGDHYCLKNLERLHKLESLSCQDRALRDDSLRKLNFPGSLKKLTLSAWSAAWEDVLGKIGSLPLLQKLTLGRGFFRRGRWEANEGHFPSLKYLSLQLCDDLECWIAESSHFPRLQTLHLYGLSKLKEISSEVGEIPTLRSIQLYFCGEQAVQCAKRIVEEQEELQGDEVSFRVRVVARKGGEALQSLASPNFEVDVRNY